MKRILLLLVIGTFLGSGLFAQAYTSAIAVRKTQQAAAAIKLPYGTDPVEDGLKQYMQSKGYKGTGSNGFLLFRGVPMEAGDTTLNDLYFKAEAPGRKEKDMTVLSLVPGKVNQDLAASGADSVRLDKAKAYLDGMTAFMTTYNTGLLMNSAQDLLGKAQRKMNSLISDSSDLVKKQRDLTADLEENKKDQVKAASELQTSVNNDDDTKQKKHKKLNKLLDQEASLQKKLRRADQDLAENKSDQEKQRAEVSRLQQGLDSVKARQVK